MHSQAGQQHNLASIHRPSSSAYDPQALRFPPLIEGRLLRRYKRFLADVELQSGEMVVAHCPNPGSMKTMNTPGAAVWLSHSTNAKRKLAYTWELVQSEGALTLVHTGRANAIVKEALELQVVAELAAFTTLRSEVAYGEKSRVDFVLDWQDASAFVEVKSVTMSDGPARAAFPDSVTSRGEKHLRELMAMVQLGHRAVMLFCCSRAGTTAIRPADEIDPAYGRRLREASEAGVELLAYSCQLSTQEVVLVKRIAIDLD